MIQSYGALALSPCALLVLNLEIAQGASLTNPSRKDGRGPMLEKEVEITVGNGEKVHLHFAVMRDMKDPETILSPDRPLISSVSFVVGQAACSHVLRFFA
jgi:hypothetical protein